MKTKTCNYCDVDLEMCNSCRGRYCSKCDGHSCEASRMKFEKPIMKTQHTPGPWKLGNGGMVYTTDLMTCIASTFGHDGNPLEEQYANARLIAAAPEMLSLLKVIEHEVMLNDIRPLPWLDDVTSLIAKAEGRE